MLRTVMVLGRSSAVGGAVWAGLALDADWIPFLALGAATAWALTASARGHRAGEHRKVLLLRTILRLARELEMHGESARSR